MKVRKSDSGNISSRGRYNISPDHILLRLMLFFYDYAGFGRTNLGAGSVISAEVGIDDIFRVPGRDGIDGAFADTGIAHDAIIGDNICQSNSSLSNFQKF